MKLQAYFFLHLNRECVEYDRKTCNIWSVTSDYHVKLGHHNRNKKHCELITTLAIATEEVSRYSFLFEMSCLHPTFSPK